MQKHRKRFSWPDCSFLIYSLPKFQAGATICRTEHLPFCVCDLSVDFVGMSVIEAQMVGCDRLMNFHII